MTQAIQLNYRDLFRREINQARQLGYQVQVATSATAAMVRLVPANDKARHAIRTANPDATAIEAACPLERGGETFAVRDALHATLEMAKDAA